jgi:hypothetical protein
VQIPATAQTGVGDGMVTAADRKRLDLNTRSHAHLRAAFRSINPVRRGAYNGILYFAHDVLKELLVMRSYHLIRIDSKQAHMFFITCCFMVCMLQPPSTPERGAYLHSASGSAGALQDAHILILLELSEVDPSSIGELRPCHEATPMPLHCIL